MLSDTKNIEGLIRQLPEWNLSVVGEEAIKAGMKMLADTDYVSRSVRLIRAEREYLSRAFTQMGLTVYESNCAYILLQGPQGLYEKLLKRGILIRSCSDYMGLGQGYYRIAVKTHPENEILTEVMRGVMHEL